MVFQTVRFKLVLSVFLACLIPYIVSSLYISRVVVEEAQVDFTRLSEEYTNKVYLLIQEAFINPTLSDVTMMAKDPRTVRLANLIKDRVIGDPQELDPELYSHLALFCQTHEKIQGLAIGTRWGGYFKYPEFFGDKTFDPRTRLWYQEALVDKAKVTITQPYMRLDKEVVLAAARAIEGETDSPGVLVTGWSLATLQKAVESMTIGSNGYVMIFKNDVLMISPRHPEWLLKTPEELPVLGLRDVISKNGHLQKIDMNGVEYYAYTNKGQGKEWKIVSVISAAELGGSVNRALNSIIPIYLVTITFILFTLYFAAKSMTDPVSCLSRGALALAAGDYSTRVQIHRRDEFGVLAGIFNKMAEQIQENFHKIKTQSEELREREHYYKTLIENAKDIIIRSDANLRILYVNPIVESYTGYLPHEYIGKRISETSLPEEVRLSVDQVWQKTYDTRQEQWSEFEFTGRNELFFFQVHVVPEYDETRAVSSLLTIIHNVTERKQIERKMARWDRLNLIGEMAAGIAHEIRNPLTTVRGYLQLMANSANHYPNITHFQLMIEEIDRANSIITEFLSLAKNKTAHLKQANLNDIIGMIHPLMQADALLINKEVRLELTPIPDQKLDEKEIRQLILNLVRNGLEAMIAGRSVTIKTCHQGGRIVLAVQDQGSGIPSEIMDKLGTPFFTTKHSGTGLGLAMCHSIAARHAAEIKIDTSAAGTTVYVLFS